MIARDKALAWRRRIRAANWDAALAMARRFKVAVNVVPLDILPIGRRVWEVYYKGEIWIDSGLSAASRLWYLVHALGHLIMHNGDQQWLRDNGYGIVEKQEEQAERFAAFFLAPTLADLFRLPPDKRAFRVRLETVCGLRAA